MGGAGDLGEYRKLVEIIQTAIILCKLVMHLMGTYNLNYNETLLRRRETAGNAP
jgi:hypothetical protein